MMAPVPRAAVPQQKAAPKPKPKPRRQASTAPASDAGTGSGRGQGIVVLVNDEPITAYEVDQRATLMAAGAGIGQAAQANFKRLAQDPRTNQRLQAILKETIEANRGKSREQILAAFEVKKKTFVVSLQKQAVSSARVGALSGIRPKALDELIEERLKLQEAKRLGIAVPADEVTKAFKGFADRNKVTEQQFVAQLQSQGIDAESIKARLRAALAWRDVIRRRFGHQISVSGREVDQLIEKAGGTGAPEVSLQLHKITLAITGGIDQRIMAKRLAEGERLRQRFGGCRSTQALAKGVADARFENLTDQSASTIAEPTRSLLLNAKEGEMVPPSLTAAGVELYAVCGRKVAKASEKRREEVQQELTMREFEVLSRRHIRDLRTDALIEHRKP